ncbi:MAG: hypothetical protein H0T70_01625 [Acidimicrobiia bacterium]|nr:hypothetical protein [Acidimicrobiia bacterium]
MTASKIRAPIPRVALELAEAAAALGMSPSSFDRYVRPHVRLIRKGSLVLVPLAELERWAAENAEHVMDGVAVGVAQRTGADWETDGSNSGSAKASPTPPCPSPGNSGPTWLA